MAKNLKYKKLIFKKNINGKIIKLLNFNKKRDQNVKEVYITTVYKNRIKGWNMHTKNTTSIFLINGRINLFYFDKRKKKKTIDDKFSNVIIIPPKVKFAFKGLAKESCILSMSNGIYNINELKKFEFN